MIVVPMDYHMLTSLFVAGLAALLMYPKQPLLPLLPGLAALVAYGESARVAMLQITFLLAFFGGLIETVRN